MAWVPVRYELAGRLDIRPSSPQHNQVPLASVHDDPSVADPTSSFRSTALQSSMGTSNVESTSLHSRVGGPRHYRVPSVLLTPSGRHYKVALQSSMGTSNVESTSLHSRVGGPRHYKVPSVGPVHDITLVAMHYEVHYKEHCKVISVHGITKFD
jgi:hypothetical protein